MRTHELKIQPAFFDAADSMKKPFEVRKDDRFYVVGDLLSFREFDGVEYTGRQTRMRRITYILGPEISDGLQPGYVVLGLKYEWR